MNGSGSKSQSSLTSWPKRIQMTAYIFLVLSGGVLYGLHVQNTKTAIFAFFSTVPWILLSLHPKVKGNGLCFLAMIYLMFIIGAYWLRGFNTKSWITASLFYIPFFLPMFYLPRIIRSRWPSFPLALLWPLIFTGMEWFRIRFSPGEISFCQLGYSQVESTKLIQIADIAGVSAISFILCAIAGLIAEIILYRNYQESIINSRRLLLTQALGVFLLYVTTIFYGYLNDTEKYYSLGPHIQVVQPSLREWREPEAARRNFDILVYHTISTHRPQLADVIVWPENSLLNPLVVKKDHKLQLHEYYGTRLVELSMQLNTPILVDGPSIDSDQIQEYHTATFIHPDGRYETYNKIMLVPWSEYVPFRETAKLFGEKSLRAYLNFVRSFVWFAADIKPGDTDNIRAFNITTRNGEHLTFGTPICFEITTTRVINKWHDSVDKNGKKGVNFLLNPTNEILLGESIRQQTLAICRFRAIEGRVSVVRAANNGVSALIDPNGRIRESFMDNSGANEPTAFYPQIILDSRRGTFYTRHGDWLPFSCFFISIWLSILALWHHYHKRYTKAKLYV